MAGSRAILRREYGVPVKDFCYPAGRFDATVVAAVEAAGYVGATTEIPGYAEPRRPYELARFEILGSTGVSGLAEDCSAPSGLEADREPGVGEVALGVADPVLAVVEDRGAEDGVGAARRRSPR